jgi:hypothetical protein
MNYEPTLAEGLQNLCEDGFWGIVIIAAAWTLMLFSLVGVPNYTVVMM